MANWSDWSGAIAQAKLGVTPAELHGSVSGYLCAGWGGSAHELLAALALESGDAGTDDALHALLDAAARDIHARLGRGEGVEPLLPEGGVSQRADALVDWCRGFLGGIGLTGVLEKQGHDHDSVLADFGHIASMHLESDDDDEGSLGEVLEFVRTGVAHLHQAFAPRARP
ncbi:MAG TPA: UPF0149 family protein [Rhodanobacteraceae bacterium]|nr:UPF0149 family protein [Rhodanobacteraceae bacterium]